MVYFYAGLGVAMLAGIMAIFEMGLSLTGRSLLPSPTDQYLLSGEIKEMDRDLLEVLANSEALPSNLRGLEICAGLELKLADALKDDWPFSSAQETSTTRFPGGCVMNAGRHRVLVQPNPSYPNPSKPVQRYQLYSCVLQGSDQLCLFEQEVTF